MHVTSPEPRRLRRGLDALLWLTATALLLLVGCGRTDFIAPGDPGGPCFDNIDCGAGLRCVEGICEGGGGIVTPDVGGDTGGGDVGEACNPGEAICAQGTRLVCEGGELVESPCPPNAVCEGGRCVEVGECEEGAVRCSGTSAQLCRDGRFVTTDECRGDTICRRGRCINNDQRLPNILVAFGFIEAFDVVPGQSIFYEFSVVNTGEADASAFTCGVYLTETFEPNLGADPLIAEVRFRGLGQGEEIFQPGEFNFPRVDPSFYGVYLYCDSFDEVAESNEGDNVQFIGEVEVRDEDGLPDLVALDSSVSPLRFEPGETLSLRYELGNFGNGPLSQGFRCRWYLTENLNRPRPERDLLLEDTQVFARLQPGEAFGDAFNARAPRDLTPGSYGLYMLCDAFGEEELSFDNNLIRLGQVVVLGDDPDEFVDLTVQLFEVSPFPAQNGREVFGIAEVCNEGTTFAEQYEVRLDAYIEPFEGAIITEGEGFLDFGLEPGGCRIFELFMPQVICIVDGPRDFQLLGAQVTSLDGLEPPERRGNNFSFVDIEINCLSDGMCVGDRFDPEDERDPPFLPPGETTGLRLCPMDVDTFTLPFLGGLVDVSYTSASGGDAFLEVIAETPEGILLPLLGTESVNGRVQIREEFDLGEFGRLFLRLVSLEGEGFGYSLVVGESDRLPDLVAGDINLNRNRFEPGETFSVRTAASNQGTAPSGVYLQSVYLVPGRGDDPNRRRLLFEVERGNMPSGTTRSDTLQVTLPDNLTAGAYTLVIDLDEPDLVAEQREDNNAGQVAIQVVQGDLQCEDQFGNNGNNTLSRAAELPAIDSVYQNLVVCSEGGEDFFVVCLPQDAEVTFRLDFEDDLGDIDLVLFNEEGDQVDRSNGVGDTEEVTSGRLMEEGCYTLRVFLFAGGGGEFNNYDLTVDVEGVEAPSLCEVGEPNNDATQATFIDPDVQALEASFCPAGDVDFYSFEGAGGQSYSITVEPTTNTPGAFSMTLFDADENFLTQRFAASVNLDFTPEEDGLYLIRLVNTTSTDTYDYAISVSPQP